MNRGAVWLLLAVTVLAGCDERREGPWQPAGKAAASARRLDGSELLARHRVSPTASAIMAGAVSFGPLAAMLAAALSISWVHRRRAAAERAAASLRSGAPPGGAGHGPLAGGRCLLAGRVEPDPSAPGPPVVVHIHQRAREYRTKTGYTHQWREAGRDVLVRPFLLRRDDGLLVRVEPDARLEVRAALARVQGHARDSRTRTAEVRAGARVLVSGELSSPANGSSCPASCPLPRTAPGLRRGPPRAQRSRWGETPHAPRPSRPIRERPRTAGPSRSSRARRCVGRGSASS